jgi:outer membrane receptor protein involved in Fe transport
MRTRPPLPRPRALLLALAAALGTACASANDLTTLSLEQLLSVTVTGASKYAQAPNEVPASVSVLTRADITAFGWRTLDEALASLPGVHLTNDRQYTYIGLRGFGLPGDFNTRMLVTIDGNRVNEPVFDSGPMGHQLPLDLGLVERIEFIPGPGGAVYGQNAMFGVVNIVTRRGADLAGVEVDMAVQQPQRQRDARVSWGGRLADGTDLLVSATGLDAGGQDLRMDFGAFGVSGVARGQDMERDAELFVRASRPGWAATLVHGNWRKHDPTGAYFADPLVRGQYQGDRYLLADLRVERPLADDAQLVARLFAGAENYESALAYEGSRYAFPAAGRWFGTELQLLLDRFAGHRTLLGVELQRNDRLDQYILDLGTPANDMRIERDGWRAGLFVQDEWRIGDTLRSTLGLRLDRGTGFDLRTSPRAALIWDPAPGTTLKALAGRAHRAPNSYERDYDDGFAQVANPGLVGETIDTFELAADRRVGSALRWHGAAYAWRMRNLIALGIDPVSGLPQYRAGGEVRARGVELGFTQGGDGALHLRGSLALQAVRNDDGRAAVNSPHRLAKLAALLPLGAARLALEWRAESGRRQIDGSRLGGVALLDMNLATQVGGVGLSLRVRNLLDRQYAQPGADTNWQDAIVQDGRTVRLEARLRY